MVEEHLYQRIAEHFRQQILTGELKPGEKLPTIRELTVVWDCTPGTIQRAYQSLIQEGLIVSRVGLGTRVVDRPVDGRRMGAALRWARLVHRAESFLLESINAGYTVNEIELGVSMALDRWRQWTDDSQQPAKNTIRFAGSHDLMISWISAHANEIIPGWRLDVSFSGSLGGLITLASGNAELAGCHLWDADNQEYNKAYVQRLLPGQRAALVTLAGRRQGLIVAPGNPKQIHDLGDLTTRDVRFINRQTGSGTRVWLDTMLQAQRIDPEQIQGYEMALMTHSEVARQVAEGGADVGLGFEGAARAFNLDFLPLTNEVYDLVILESHFEHPALQALVQWIGSTAGKQQIANLDGYDTEQSGALRWVG